jgi:hypothetical protein
LDLPDPQDRTTEDLVAIALSERVRAAPGSAWEVSAPIDLAYGVTVFTGPPSGPDEDQYIVGARPVEGVWVWQREETSDIEGGQQGFTVDGERTFPPPSMLGIGSVIIDGHVRCEVGQEDRVFALARACALALDGWPPSGYRTSSVTGPRRIGKDSAGRPECSFTVDLTRER